MFWWTLWAVECHLPPPKKLQFLNNFSTVIAVVHERKNKIGHHYELTMVNAQVRAVALSASETKTERRDKFIKMQLS